MLNESITTIPSYKSMVHMATHTYTHTQCTHVPPPPNTHTQPGEQVDGEDAPPTKKWWQFWKRKKDNQPPKFGWITGVLVSSHMYSHNQTTCLYSIL